jgi:ADP-heptose:LPS heptosyltransferase
MSDTQPTTTKYQPKRVPPRRILILRPCCIGDVVLATGALAALRRAYPAALISWGVSSWAKDVIAHHPMLDYTFDLGAHALPVKSWRGFWQIRTIVQNEVRKRRYDWVVSLVRSPVMSAAVGISGAEVRAGLASGWRGFGYNVKVPVSPNVVRHEAEIYLDVVRALDIDTTDIYPTIPVDSATQEEVTALLERRNLGTNKPFIIINPAGGMNPGMQMVSKRYPVAWLAQIADAIADELGAHIVIVSGGDDVAIVNDLRAQLRHSATSFVGELRFDQIAALCAKSALYIGNDTGLTHLSAATGAPTVMMMGPSDPRRYAPVNPNSIALWREVDLPTGGVSQTAPSTFDWQRDGIPPDEALIRIREFMA